MTLNVYIGTEDNQLIPQKVLEYSINKNAKKRVNIYPVKQETERVGGTNFGFVRFMVPRLNDYQGKAIYLDADQLVFVDINEMADELDNNYAVGLVNRPKGTFGPKPLAQINQTSVMVLNCNKLTSWDPETMFRNVVPNRAELAPGQIHYRDFMKLDWFDSNEIQAIDPRWNHFNIVEEDTKLTHFSYVREQPWRNPSHPLAKFWGRWLRKAIRAGAVGRVELLKEIVRGSVHKRFLAYML